MSVGLNVAAAKKTAPGDAAGVQRELQPVPPQLLLGDSPGPGPRRQRPGCRPGRERRSGRRIGAASQSLSRKRGDVAHRELRPDSDPPEGPDAADRHAFRCDRPSRMTRQFRGAREVRHHPGEFRSSRWQIRQSRGERQARKVRSIREKKSETCPSPLLDSTCGPTARSWPVGSRRVPPPSVRPEARPSSGTAGLRGRFSLGPIQGVTPGPSRRVGSPCK